MCEYSCAWYLAELWNAMILCSHENIQILACARIYHNPVCRLEVDQGMDYIKDAFSPKLSYLISPYLLYCPE